MCGGVTWGDLKGFDWNQIVAELRLWYDLKSFVAGV